MKILSKIFRIFLYLVVIFFLSAKLLKFAKTTELIKLFNSLVPVVQSILYDNFIGGCLAGVMIFVTLTMFIRMCVHENRAKKAFSLLENEIKYDKETGFHEEKISKKNNNNKITLLFPSLLIFAVLTLIHYQVINIKTELATHNYDGYIVLICIVIMSVIICKVMDFFNKNEIKNQEKETQFEQEFLFGKKRPLKKVIY